MSSREMSKDHEEVFHERLARKEAILIKQESWLQMTAIRFELG